MSSEKKMVTPLQPRQFFSGIWKGECELIPRLFVRWFVPKEHIRFQSNTVCLSDTVWIVKEMLEFSSGTIVPRTMFVEIKAPDRLHVTADDMPLGADIALSQEAFRFTPYYVWSRHRGRRWRLRCLDENVIDQQGTIHDTVKMFFLGIHVATMYLTINRMEEKRNTGNAA